MNAESRLQQRILACFNTLVLVCTEAGRNGLAFIWLPRHPPSVALPALCVMTLVHKQVAGAAGDHQQRDATVHSDEGRVHGRHYVQHHAHASLKASKIEYLNAAQAERDYY